MLRKRLDNGRTSGALMSADSPEIEIGAVDGALYVGLGGRATQRTCPTVDRLVSDYLSTQPTRPQTSGSSQMEPRRR